jgi:5-methylcytosine-specific restriction endonuclease McrA
MTYADQLKSPKWQKKRLEILERDDFTCLACGNKEKQLHVHHGIYLKGKMAWEYENYTLHTLCFSCHEEAGPLIEELKNQISYAIPKSNLLNLLSKLLNYQRVLSEFDIQIIDTLLDNAKYKKDYRNFLKG